ncbi:TetR/AcrR family transcriptional regulator [Amycolatopsis mongoliensis]|uniref:TetR/AcrR family transcriptional regulator n=1 Tax=Amycolatopsis mongoliensis TaxID=715475 RepID=A0A9Y2NI77_9PSEU|nr:TetR/AcrR family transcriptional regulator [Amycolatopsis sp. 4-36]WIY06586.1 TetR/AcrR family transcriptional regulator [Amycolatopsis sp. 4-36]
MAESRRDRKKRETRQRIVSAAIRLFDEQGYEETTVDQVAKAADVDPKTFFNYFRTKADVLFGELDLEVGVLLAAIADRRPGESPGEVVRRAFRAYAAHRRPGTARKEPAELSATARLALTTPALQAKGMHLLLDMQRQVTDGLVNAFPGELDPVTAAAMTGAVLGAIQQAGLAGAQLGRSQDELWEAAEHALDIVSYGLLSAGRRTTNEKGSGPHGGKPSATRP